MNINDQATVILTKHGQDILYNYRTNLEKRCKVEFKSIYQCDQNGKYTTELWVIMNIFGQYMYMGSEQVFVNNQIYIN